MGVPVDDRTISMIRDATDGIGIDQALVTAASSSSDPLLLATNIARDRGTVVLVGDVPLDIPRSALYDKELAFRVSRSYGPGRYDRNYEEKGMDYPIGYVRWTEQRNMACVLDLEARGKLVLGDLIDASSVGGGTFELGSQAFAMTRIVTGQLDAVIEVGSRLVDDVPGMRAEFERVGDGHVLNNSPYDLAAPALCLTEAGGALSDGWGRPLDDRPLLGSGHEFQMSSISAANPALHEQLVRAVDEGVARLKAQRG